jgi:aryl-alcohol dehydrogenase-like predicted oxidoreductase
MASLRKSVDRRTFLKLGAAASGLAVGGCGSNENFATPPATLELGYRPLGGTGLKVSEVAFGAHQIDRPDLMRAAIDAGINTFCTSGPYLDGREEMALGEAMAAAGNSRDEVVIITGMVVRPGASTKNLLEEIDASLRRLRTDHIDIYLTGEVRTVEDVRVDELYEAFDIARQAGKIGHLGLSGHSGGMQACLNAAIDDGQIEVFFIKYDFVSYPDQEEILRRAAQRGIGTIVFKTNAGNRQQEIEDLEAGGLSFPQATVKWALTNPDVASVAVSMSNFDTIRQYTAAASTTLSSSEVAMLRRYAGEMYDKYCRFCGDCEKHCPHGVAVADVNRFAMYFSGYGREKEAMGLYRTLSARRSAASCDGCPGHCDKGCPFGRRVRTELVAAHRQLSFLEV